MKSSPARSGNGQGHSAHGTPTIISRFASRNRERRLSAGHGSALCCLVLSAGLLLAAGFIHQWYRTLPQERLSSPGQWIIRLWEQATAFEGFQTYTINLVLGGPGPAALLIGLIAGLWVGVSLLLWLGWRWLHGRPVTLAPVALLVLAGWLVLDLRWQWDLGQQLTLTREQFAGLSSEQKRLAEPGFDGATYQFARIALEHTADDPEQRFFVISPIRYWRYRVAYFLYPRNVAVALVESEQLRSGDHLLFFNEPRLQAQPIDQDRVRLLLDEQPYAVARPVVLTRLGQVFRVE